MAPLLDLDRHGARGIGGDGTRIHHRAFGIATLGFQKRAGNDQSAANQNKAPNNKGDHITRFHSAKVAA